MRHNGTPMDPDQRRWWRWLEDLPERLGRVERWIEVPPPPIQDDGGHLHAVPSLVVGLTGVVRVRRPAGACDLHAGDALVIAPGVWHEHLSVRAGSAFFAQGFLPTASDVLIGDHRRRFHGLLPREPSHRLCCQVLTAADPQARCRHLRALLTQVLAERVTDHGATHPAVRLMVKRLWSGLHRGVTVDDLVRASGLSRSQAYRVFTVGYGVSPKAALEGARLELADSLAATGLSKTETASRSGFSSPRALARARTRAAHGRTSHPLQQPNSR